jgi:hypothetical protein
MTEVFNSAHSHISYHQYIIPNRVIRTKCPVALRKELPYLLLRLPPYLRLLLRSPVCMRGPILITLYASPQKSISPPPLPFSNSRNLCSNLSISPANTYPPLSLWRKWASAKRSQALLATHMKRKSPKEPSNVGHNSWKCRRTQAFRTLQESSIGLKSGE